MKTVLIVEDERKLREALMSALTSAGHRAIGAAGVAEAKAALDVEDVRCVLLDIRLKDGDGLALLAELRASSHRDVPVIIATAYGDSERTIQAMRDGAFDYVTKPFDLDALLAKVGRAVKQRDIARMAPLPDSVQRTTNSGLVGSSEAMLDVWKTIGRAAAEGDAPVLITGETGTGKELVARAIHQYSPRSAEPFVAVNLAALPPSLLESELFGHEKGAFTGATGRRLGRLEAAGAGTLLLDEIGDLDVALQTKLLRVLQDGQFERVGGEQPIKNRARVVAATNKAVAPNQPGAMLREDLYYRLAVIGIEVPPLRARRSDVPLLVAFALEGSSARAVTEEAMARLMAYDWPGNVRELVHVVKRAAVMCGSEVIDAADLPLRSLTPARPAEELMTLKEALQATERRMILSALERSKGNRSEAARMLGMARPHLYAKMEEHGLGAKDEDRRSVK